MKIIAVDDEQKALNSVLRVLREVEPETDVVSFTDSQEAFTYLSDNRVDIALLDIKMGGLTGVELAEKCKSLCPTVNIIFITGYSQYTMDALRLHVSGYLMKPIRADDLRTELSNLRHPLPDKRIRIQTFGNFEVFVDGKPLKVPLRKCKECLAYLVDRRGAGISYAQLSAVLWEEQPIGRQAQKNTHKIIAALRQSLKEVGAEELLIRSRMEIAIDTGQVDCDYFKAIGGEREWLNSFTGEYMSNYSWGEFTLGELLEIKNKIM